ncbi:BlaI/MecI/CopY family transcriptional regulator [Porticoccaceae bacterium LTM1]|nr:BlaI/MecI/CopY family transcriptional regulator [Porticoccaceae bacterium LTM1]
MAKDLNNSLTRRERQIMDALFQRGESSAQDVLESLPNPPGYSAVRAMLSKLEQKGLIEHREEGAKYIYRPAVEHSTASESAIKRLLRTFFGGSAAAAVNTLLDLENDTLSDKELADLEERIARARQKNKEAR